MDQEQDIPTNDQDTDVSAIENSFPIIGIGASAGGLEAFEDFFSQMPPDSGMAFVLVQHLDPNHESILVQLLKNSTPMDVFQVEDGMQVQPNNIYVIPPNRNMALLHSTLYLIELIEARGPRLPIDFFFQSLAEDQVEKAICIVLSGTGTDGTRGLRAIRGEGGMTMVQDPETARYDGMPRSAIATGLADYVLTPHDMPDQLLDYTGRLFESGVKRVPPPPIKESETLDKIFILLRSQTKHDFSLYKRNTINRRIERRMAVNQIEHAADYVRYLQQTPLEVETLFRELLIGVTSFFRDQEAFEALEQKAIPELFEDRRTNQPVRVWVPGCSTGEEAYSIAILIREQMSVLQQEFEVQIFATDIDAQAIETARLGLYTESLIADIAPDRLHQFFVKEGANYQVGRQIREMVIFAVQSVTKDPPFSKMDLISCRNLLIYLGSELQKRVIPLFHYALNLNGILLLGTSETLGEFDRYFTPIDRKMKLFQRTGVEAAPQGALDFTLPISIEDRVDAHPVETKDLNVREIAERTLLQEYTPPCVIINDQGEILYFHGKTGKYLEPASGEASLNLLRMAREGLRYPLNAAVRDAYAQRQEVIYENIRLVSDDSEYIINVIVSPIAKPTTMQGLYLVVFDDVLPLNRAEATSEHINVTDDRDQRLMELERELQSTREYLQTTIEELETTNEELKSTNEELQSSNEELQSTNEELETAKEELQSVNEELVTVNSELQSKIDELTIANNDLTNLLASIEIGTIFLDQHLHIQRFNPSVTHLINLIQTDVGRPIGHIVSNLGYDDLVQDARAVLDNLVPREIEVQDADSRWYLLRIRPYRTVENVIDGLVLTFSEITDQKRAEQAMQDAQQYAENIVDTVRDSLLVLDIDLRIVSANRSFYQTFDLQPANTEDRLIYELDNGQWNIPALRELLEEILPTNTSFDGFEVTIDFETIGQRIMRLNARQINQESVAGRLILLAIEDIT